MNTNGRTFTSWVREDGERVLRELPFRIGEPCPMPDREPLDFTDWNRAGRQFTRDRIYQNNAAQWLRETIEALADQADFTAAATLRDLCETYDRKARGE